MVFLYSALAYCLILVYDYPFFFFLGKNRSGEFACTAYVTFKDAYSQETACLLSVSIDELFARKLIMCKD